MPPLDRLLKQYEDAARMLRGLDVEPRTVVVLGSGQTLGGAGFEREIPYHEVPGIPRPTVEGHGGAFRWSETLGALICAGRFHAYEGYTIGAIAFAPALASLLGAEALLLCNSAGGLNPEFKPGELMLIEDQLNFISPGQVALADFLDAERPPRERPLKIYDFAWPEGRTTAEGVYASVPGPTYETPVEAEFLRRAGADAVGMSTAWEALAGRLLGLRVGGVSLITNSAGGLSAHEDVLRAAERGGEALERLLLASLARGGAA